MKRALGAKKTRERRRFVTRIAIRRGRAKNDRLGGMPRALGITVVDGDFEEFAPSP